MLYGIRSNAGLDRAAATRGVWSAAQPLRFGDRLWVATGEGRARSWDPVRVIGTANGKVDFLTEKGGIPERSSLPLASLTPDTLQRRKYDHQAGDKVWVKVGEGSGARWQPGEVTARELVGRKPQLKLTVYGTMHEPSFEVTVPVAALVPDLVQSRAENLPLGTPLWAKVPTSSGFQWRQGKSLGVTSNELGTKSVEIKLDGQERSIRWPLALITPDSVLVRDYTTA